MDREEGNEVPSVYVYNGVGIVPEDVAYVRVDSSVTALPNGAFLDCRDLEVVELHEGLIRIGYDAFEGCKSLKRINLPSTVVEIGREAFRNCEKLDEITLPQGLHRLGARAFYHCTSLKTINVPPGIEVIEEGTFFSCKALTNVSFSEGLQEIEEDGFSRCNALVSINLPSTLKDIGIEAFEGCPRLEEIHMPNAIETIKRRAFEGCNFANFRMPPLVTEVDIGIAHDNKCLVSIELPENASGINGEAVLTLRNIALPPECDIGTYTDVPDLLEAFPENRAVRPTLEALQHRFDNLPIHKICYYQSYHDNESTMQNLKREINPWTTKPPGQLNLTGKEQDCLGMTPLHILACSTKQNVEMYRLLIDKYPETLIMKDKWDDIPLLYAIWCNAPPDVVDLLVESYKSNHSDYEFDWSGMLLTLAKRRVPLANIQRLINTQLNSFPEQTYDMQQVVMQLARRDASQASFNKPFTSVDTVQYLLRVSITKRLELLAVSSWCVDMENSINNLNYCVSEVSAMYDRLATYESIKEGTSVLELALWKAKIDESRDKRARVSGEDVSYKEQTRVNSGADVVIRNILPYLMPK